MTTSLLTAQQIQKSFSLRRRQPSVPVLRNISLTVRAGEMVSIVGPSGSGKSTLLYCLSGLEPCSSGTVSILGQDIETLRRGALAALRRDHIGFVFQEYNLIPSLNARENVALPARLSRKHVTRRDINSALIAVGLEDRARHRPNELSGGQQQRVAIARVLAMHPDIVFADEPTGSLDTVSGSKILRLLRDAAFGSRSVVLVTHDLEAAALADRVLVLRDGEIHRELAAPTPDQVFDAVSTAGAST